MEKFVAIVFNSEAEAREGAKTLFDLHRNGELAVYAAGIIVKDLHGKVKMQKSTDDGPVGMALGVTIGALVGVLAGPAAIASGAAVAGSAAAVQAAAGGVALGSVTGGLAGAYRDLLIRGMDVSFLDIVAVELLPAKAAIVATVDEIWTTPLNARMKAMGGTIYRKARVEILDQEIEAEIMALDRELTYLEEELSHASDDMAADITASLDETKRKLKQKGENAADRIKKLDAELQERLNALDTQLQNAPHKTIGKVEKRKREIQTEFKERTEKLGNAVKITASVTL